MSQLPTSLPAKPADVIISEFSINGVDILQAAETGISGFEIVIREDIFSNFLTATMVVTDTRDSFRMLNLTGNDIVYVEWMSSKQFKPSSFYGVVKNYQDYSIQKEGQHIYRFNMISLDGFNDSVARVSKAFIGKTATEIMESVFKNHLLSSEELHSFPCPTQMKHDFIAPYWKPSEIINYMAGKAVSKSESGSVKLSGGAGFRFFQTVNDGYYFASIKDMIDTNKHHTLTRMRYSLNNIAANGNADSSSLYQDHVSQLELGENIGVINLIPSIDMVNSGAFGYDLNTYDITTKAMNFPDKSSPTYQYSKNYKPAVGGSPFNFLNDDDQELFDPEQTRQPRFMVGQKYLNQSYSTEASTFQHNDTTKFQRIVTDQMFRMVKIRGTIYGASDLSVGDVMEFNLPVPDNQGQVESKFHKYINGKKWVVASVAHQIGGPRYYTQQIELIRDGIEGQ